MCVCLFVCLKNLRSENTINFYTMTPTMMMMTMLVTTTTMTTAMAHIQNGQFGWVENILFIYRHFGNTLNKFKHLSTSSTETKLNRRWINSSLCHFRFLAHWIPIFDCYCWCWQIKIQWHKIVPHVYVCVLRPFEFWEKKRTNQRMTNPHLFILSCNYCLYDFVSEPQQLHT